VSKHNRERRQFLALARREKTSAVLTNYQIVRISKHGKRKLARLAGK
jgi:hypothetical protein